jgi:hypothetical protein
MRPESRNPFSAAAKWCILLLELSLHAAAEISDVSEC